MKKLGLSQALLLEGDYEAIIEITNLKRDVITQYGIKDIVEITYQVSTKVAKVKFKEKIYLSQAEGSKCMQLVHELYKDTLPEIVSFKENIGRKVTLTFNHEQDAQENTYDNIVKRVFHN